MRVRIALAVLLFPVAAFAQSGVIVIPADSDVVREDRDWRTRDFAAQIEKEEAAGAVTHYADRRAEFLRSRAENRAKCRGDIRRANKTMLMKTVLACYKTDMTLTKEFTTQQKEYAQAIAGITPAVRNVVFSKSDQLLTAIGAVLLGIESNVYDNTEDIMEVKSNLYTKYQLPLWDGLTMLRADRALTWAGQLIRTLDTLRAQETASGSVRQTPSAARVCLGKQEAALRPLTQSATQQKSQKLLQILPAIEDCVKDIRAIERLSGSGSQS